MAKHAVENTRISKTLKSSHDEITNEENTYHLL